VKCPKCGDEMSLVEKHTFTGEDIREYCCGACKETVIDRRGTALWQVLHDANAERESGKK
jgi:hypothetical protein